MLFGFGLVTKDGFQLKELFEPGLTHSRPLPDCVSTKATTEIQPRAVNVTLPDRIRFATPRACSISPDVTYPDSPIGSVVGNSDSIVFIFVWEDAKNGPKISSRAIVMSF